MKLSSMFKWAKDLVGKPEPSGVFKLGHGVAAPTTGMGKSPFSDAIVKTLASIGACSGDIVEVNEFGAARVVGRRPQLASGRPDASEQAIRERQERPRAPATGRGRETILETGWKKGAESATSFIRLATTPEAQVDSGR
ncbi:hypothetical protein [Burkholderia gladioli]|uniref:hypothetical protein n=1 Tax=Burkholderia gladioli TaxID=28095 RepID=UPI002FE158F0